MALAALTLSACAGTGSGSDERTEGGAGPSTAASSPAVEASDATSPDATAAPTGGPAVENAAALAFTGVDLSGAPVDGQSFAGGDVVLWMWAPW